MLRVSFFFGGGRSVTSPASLRHISVCFFNPKKLPKRWICEEEDLNNGNNGNLWIFLWLRHPSLILWWFYVNFSLLDIFSFSAMVVVLVVLVQVALLVLHPIPPKNIGTNTRNWEFFWGKTFVWRSPRRILMFGFGDFLIHQTIRHIFIISCSETDGVTHAVSKSHLLRWWICGLYILQYLRKGLKIELKEEASSCFVRTTGCWRDAYCSSEAWLFLLDVWTLQPLSQQVLVSIRVTIGYCLACILIEFWNYWWWFRNP